MATGVVWRICRIRGYGVSCGKCGHAVLCVGDFGFALGCVFGRCVDILGGAVLGWGWWEVEGTGGGRMNGQRCCGTLVFAVEWTHARPSGVRMDGFFYEWMKRRWKIRPAVAPSCGKKQSILLVKFSVIKTQYWDFLQFWNQYTTAFSGCVFSF